jgi:hypothetical protein
MAKSRPSVQKRNHESKKLQRTQDKAAKKAARAAAREAAESRTDGVDPDLAGIVAGPQPVAWAHMDTPDEDED